MCTQELDTVVRRAMLRVRTLGVNPLSAFAARERLRCAVMPEAASDAAGLDSRAEIARDLGG